MPVRVARPVMLFDQDGVLADAVVAGVPYTARLALSQAPRPDDGTSGPVRVRVEWAVRVASYGTAAHVPAAITGAVVTTVVVKLAQVTVVETGVVFFGPGEFVLDTVGDVESSGMLRQRCPVQVVAAE
jgi:hypothetical protein